jgi:hypothetical protein
MFHKETIWHAWHKYNSDSIGVYRLGHGWARPLSLSHNYCSDMKNSSRQKSRTGKSTSSDKDQCDQPGVDEEATMAALREIAG